MRELIPIMSVLDEICSGLKLERNEETKVAREFEDNEGALLLANSPLRRVTPQSKHFAVKYHWFREKLDEYKIKILAIRTQEQKADVFTKGLTRTEFRKKRSLMMGW